MDTEEELNHFRISSRSLNVFNHSGFTQAEMEEQCKATDEAFLMYTYAEKAASRIQHVFRERKRLQAESGDDLKEHATELENSEGDDGGDVEDTSKANEKEGTELSHRFAVVFIALVCIIQFLRRCLPCCNDKDTGAAEAEQEVRDIIVEGGIEGIDTGINGAVGGAAAGGGGGGGGPGGNMAVQAASSAGSGRLLHQHGAFPSWYFRS